MKKSFLLLTISHNKHLVFFNVKTSKSKEDLRHFERNPQREDGHESYKMEGSRIQSERDSAASAVGSGKERGCNIVFIIVFKKRLIF